MTSTQEINFRDLSRSLFDGTPASRGLKLVEEQKGSAGLPHLLRFHHPIPVTMPAEIAGRNDVDELLAFCGLLEIAAIAGFIQTVPSEPLARRIRDALEVPAVNVFYTRHYPLRLPSLYMARLEGERSVQETDAKAAEGAFCRYLLSVKTIAGDPDVECLQKLLDDFTVDGFRSDDLDAALSDFESFVAMVSTPPEEDTALTRSCRGFLKFCGFFRTLLSLLKSSDACPILGSAMWHQHAYWFKELQADLERTITRFCRGAGDSAQRTDVTSDERMEFEAAMQHQYAGLLELFDPAWGRHV